MEKFSVLMSIYYKETVSNFKESMQSILDNTLLPDEIVIVKDGKLYKELDAALDEYAKGNSTIKICGYDVNKGLGEALRFGILQCSNNLIARMDSDDICDKTRFEKQISYMSDHPECGIIGSNCTEFIETKDNLIAERVMPVTHKEIIKFSKKRNPFIHPTTVIRKDLALKAGNYRTFYLVEDYDIAVRMLQTGTMSANIPESLLFVRVGKDFYNRRGGWKYCKSILKFEKFLLKIKYINFFRYVVNAITRSVVYLSPNWLRSWIYKKKLRKNIKKAKISN